MLTIADGGGRGGPGYHFSEALLNGLFIFPLFISLFPSQDAVFQLLPLLIVFTTALPVTERNVSFKFILRLKQSLLFPKGVKYIGYCIEYIGCSVLKYINRYINL